MGQTIAVSHLDFSSLLIFVIGCASSHTTEINASVFDCELLNMSGSGQALVGIKAACRQGLLISFAGQGAIAGRCPHRSRPREWKLITGHVLAGFQFGFCFSGFRFPAEFCASFAFIGQSQL